MNLFERLNIRPGITAVIGSGGKTSLLDRLAGEAPGTTALATTTHMFPIARRRLVVSDDERMLEAARDESRIVCIGSVSAQGKIVQPALALERLAELFDFVIVEADGSRQLPLKAHADFEPAVPAAADSTILVVGASGLNRPIREAVHRPALFCERAHCAPEDLATPERVARVIHAERAAGLLDPQAAVINLGSTPASADAALSLEQHVSDLPMISCQLVRPRQEPLRMP